MSPLINFKIEVFPVPLIPTNKVIRPRILKECRSKQNDTHFRTLIIVSRSVLGQHHILPFQKIYGFICQFLHIWLSLQCNDNMNIFEFNFEKNETITKYDTNMKKIYCYS